jgi:hypothetical protein
LLGTTQPVGRPHGAVPRSWGRVAFPVWAPSVRAVGVRVGDGAHPLPKAEETFDRSKLDPSADDAAGALRLTRGRVTLTADLRNCTVEIAE